MNQAQEILQAIAERFATTASVKQVFGEAIQANGRTIVPVARVEYGPGGGEQQENTCCLRERERRPQRRQRGAPPPGP